MKEISLPSKVYDDLAKVTDELSLMAKKPISQSMAVDLLIEVYRAHLSNRCALDVFSQQLQSVNVMTPKEFDKYWDGPKMSGDKPKNQRKSKT